jgi:hypothetical protein
MIDDVDRTVAALLKRDLPADITAQVAVTFATPDEQFPPKAVKLPALSFFLYDIRENRGLRTGEWSVHKAANGAMTREREPVRLDCSYLVTAWPSASSTTPPLDEHHLLGAVLLVLLRNPVLPKSVLQGSLAGSTTDLPTTALQQGQLQDMSGFWQALHGRPRAAFGYTVTVPVQPLDPRPAAAPPKEKLFVYRVGTKIARR